MRARSGLVAAVAALLGLGLAGAESSFAQGPAGAPAPAVYVVAVAMREITPQATFTGRIEAIDKVELRARVEGFLEKRLFEEGAEVKEGDLLFLIEKASYEAAVSEAEGSVARDNGSLQLALQEEARQQQLVRSSAASQARLDEAVAKVAQAKGDLLRDNGALARARLNLGYTEIRAPFTGKIGKAAFSPGAFVGPSSGALATIVRQSPVNVSFPVTQRDLLEVQRRITGGDHKAGDVKVRVRLADGSFYEGTGEVNFVDVRMDPGTDTVRIRATLDNPQRFLVDGQLVAVVVESAAPASALVAPQQAVLIDQAGRYVLAVDAGNKAQIRRIVVGEQVDSFYVVTDGLKPGDRIITEGVQKVRPGAVVNPTETPLDPVAKPAAKPAAAKE